MRSFAMFLIVAAVVSLAISTAMTSWICHWRFAFVWNKTGQCSASDAPSEVFLSFLSMTGMISFFIAMIWLSLLIITIAMGYWGRK